MNLFNFFKRKQTYTVADLQNELRILNDCADLIEKTVNPDVFFPRYNLYYEKLSLLAEAQKKKVVKVQGDNIVKKYAKLNTEEAKIDLINAFIKRYWDSTCSKADKLKTEKGKNSCFEDFKNTLCGHNEQLPDSCIQYYNHLYSSASRTNASVPRNKIPAEQIDAMQRIKASDVYCNMVYNQFYSNYPEMPFISKDREINTDWIERAKMFPKQSLVSESMMKRYSNGLLPGHIYMLYWLGKYNKKRIPVYFEYEYGIEFEAEKDFLKENGYLDEFDKPTASGIQEIEHHMSIINKKHPIPKYTGHADSSSVATLSSERIIPATLKPGIIPVPLSDKLLLEKEFEQVNHLTVFALKLAHLSQKLLIDTRSFHYSANSTFYEACPYTPTGKPARYPLILHYAYDSQKDLSLEQNYFGDVYYMQDGNIGKARLIFWERGLGYMIHLAVVNQKLSVKKVEKSAPGNWKTIYKL